MELRFATGNTGKVREVREILADLALSVEQLDVDVLEPQEVALQEIARHKVEQAVEHTGGDAFVMADDSGLFVEALDGFPGILSSQFDATVGHARLLRLLDDGDARDASFRVVIALYDPADQDIHTFRGRCDGELVEPRGTDGFGYDPIFLPDGHEMTFAEDTAYKHEVSHRRAALDALRSHLARRQDS